MLWKRIIRQLKKFYSTIWHNVEKLKAVLLTLLIALSIFLTYSLWTFTPDNNVLENETTIEAKIPAGNKKKLSDIIQPLQVIIHHNSKHYWSYSIDQDTVYNHLQNVLLIGSDDQVKNEEEIQKDGIEIIYPTGIPVSVLTETFKFSNENPFRNYMGNIERLRVYNDEGEWKVQFIFEPEEVENSEEVMDPVVYEFETSDKSTRALVEDMVKSKNTVEVDGYKLNDNTFYLPIEEMKVNTYFYTTNAVKIRSFVQALLPQDIATTKTNNNIWYGKSKSYITYFQKSDELSYFNKNSQDEIPRQNAIIQSLDFINNHTGWTNTFYLDHYYESSLDGTKYSQQKEIYYRMIMNGFPIVGNSIGVISLNWASNQASEYNRSLVYLKEEFYNDQQKTVEKGSKVINTLSELSDANNISDITIGYALKPGKLGGVIETNSVGGTLFFLEPAWYYKIRSSSTWRPVDFESIEPIKKKGG